MEGKKMTSKEKIIKATLHLTANLGIKGTTTKKISELALVNETTIFKNFKCKDTLIHEALQLETDKIKAEIDCFFEQPIDNNKELIHKTSEFIMEIYEKYDDYMMITIKEMGSKELESVKPSIQEYLKEAVENKLDELLTPQMTHKDSEAISYIINSVILFLAADKVKNNIYGHPKKDEVEIDYLADVLERLLNIDKR
jgi:AcrR family transcriptional regulator